MCTPWPYVNQECLAGGRGLLPWEYEHFHAQHAGFEFEASTIHALHDKYDEHELIKIEAVVMPGLLHKYSLGLLSRDGALHQRHKSTDHETIWA